VSNCVHMTPTEHCIAPAIQHPILSSIFRTKHRSCMNTESAESASYRHNKHAARPLQQPQKKCHPKQASAASGGIWCSRVPRHTSSPPTMRRMEISARAGCEGPRLGTRRSQRGHRKPRPQSRGTCPLPASLHIRPGSVLAKQVSSVLGKVAWPAGVYICCEIRSPLK
jgi:hypothetical protein